jgi:hypothetical protein
MVLRFGGFLGGGHSFTAGHHSRSVEKNREKGNGEREECAVNTTFTYERSPTTWRCWPGMNATQWFGSELVGHGAV